MEVFQLSSVFSFLLSVFCCQLGVGVGRSTSSDRLDLSDQSDN